ncbi:MAG TPA: hypothetical protein VF754_01755 [Pyrinomonadaceae bacterium]
MNETQISPHANGVRRRFTARGRALSALALAVFFSLSSGAEVLAQRRVTKEYATGPSIRLFLVNRSGTITVESWEKNKVKISADMESRSARVTPQFSGDGVTINVERENGEDVGEINFTIHVPVDSTVDIQTKRGNITVRNVRGAVVRAKVSTEGDIELTGIRSATVMAENIMGNILFDAELLRNGTYELKSMQGDIQIRITADTGFRLIATAPRTRNINLGGFASRGQFEFFSDKRKVVGKVGDGGASLNTTNGRGSITFMPR